MRTIAMGAISRVFATAPCHRFLFSEFYFLGRKTAAFVGAVAKGLVFG